LEGFKEIVKKLTSTNAVITRNFSQDPLENFFGAVRSHAIRNNNPTCAGFIAPFKTLLINNMMSQKSVGSNCEEDV
jgi:hypothetical protein